MSTATGTLRACLTLCAPPFSFSNNRSSLPVPACARSLYRPLVGLVPVGGSRGRLPPDPARADPELPRPPRHPRPLRRHGGDDCVRPSGRKFERTRTHADPGQVCGSGMLSNWRVLNRCTDESVITLDNGVSICESWTNCLAQSDGTVRDHSSGPVRTARLTRAGGPCGWNTAADQHHHLHRRERWPYGPCDVRTRFARCAEC